MAPYSAMLRLCAERGATESVFALHVEADPVRRLLAGSVGGAKRRRIEAERLLRPQPVTPAEARAYVPMSK